MRKQTRWLAVLCVVGVAFVVASCAEEVPTALDENSTQAVTEAATPPDATPLAVMIGGENLTCMGDEAADTTNNGGNTYVQGMGANQPYDLNCTANDVVIALVNIDSCVGCGPKVPNPNAPPDSVFTCSEGDTLTISGAVSMQSSAQKTRSDIGWWIASDGGDGISGSCQHFWFGNAGFPPELDDLDGDPLDTCGDIGAKDFFSPVPLVNPTNTFDVVCQDSNDDNLLDAGACTGWKIPGDDQTCPDNAWTGDGPGSDMDHVKATLPANKAKCRCDPLDFPVAIVRSADVTIIKDLNPASDPGLFDLEVREYDNTTVADSAHKIGDTGSATTEIIWTTVEEGTKNKAYVEETNAYLGALSGSAAFAFYTTSYVCKDDGGAGSTVASGSGPGTGGIELADLQNGDDIVCTVTNDRIAVPTITVTKDATPTFTREWTWTITKQAFNRMVTPPLEIVTGHIFPEFAPGETFGVSYKVAVDPTSTDKDWAVSGTITVTVAGSLPPYSGTITVVDSLTPGDIAAAVDCDDQTEGDQNTVAVTAAGSFTCTYAANLPDATTLTNTATASTTWNSGDPGSGSGTASVTFGDPTTETDESVDVCDDKGSSPVSTPCIDTSGDYLGSALRQAGMFEYINDIPACVPPGDNRLNTAKFTTNDTATEDSAQHAMSWTCPDTPPGCTLTQGYWKTHSIYGPAPYDDNWALKGEDTVFLGSTVIYTWYNQFLAPPKGGNPYLKLSHQYAAAVLNVLNGADDSAVAGYIIEATAILEAHPNGKIAKKSPDGIRANELAGYLGDYNEGLIGPGHCTEDTAPD